MGEIYDLGQIIVQGQAPYRMRIRKRLSKYGKEYIRNIWGVGYSFVYTPGIAENAEQKEQKGVS